MIKNENFLKLFGNIIDNKSVNNKKFFNIVCSGINYLNSYYEKIILSDVIDKLEGSYLDYYAKQFDILRKHRTDEDFREILKLFFVSRTLGTDVNSLTKVISLFLGIKESSVQIFDSNNDKEIEPRHIKLRILEKVEMKKAINFLKKIKGAGIILDCWEFLDGEYLLNCKNEKIEYRVEKNVAYEYDRHKFDLDETLEIND